MKTLNFLTFTFFLLLVLSCGSDDEECKKTIIVQYAQVINGPGGTTIIPERTQEVPCDFEEIDAPVEVVSNPTLLENFTYEVIYFDWISDTGNNTSRLQFEIQLNNPNNYIAEGYPRLTMSIDGLVISGSWSDNASNPCYSIDSNSHCILTYDVESSLDAGITNSISLTNVEYWLND